MYRYANNEATKHWLLSLLGAAAFLGLWWGASSIFVSPLLPSPAATLRQLLVLCLSNSYWIDLAWTSYRWLGGFALGCMVGAPLGLAMGASSKIFSFLSFVFDFLRSLPVTAIFPLFLLLFGIGDSSKIAMVFAGTIFTVALNAAYGIRHSTPARVRMARAFGATRWQLTRYIQLYEAIPQIVIGMRSTITVALIVVVVSEMFIGTEHGIGQDIYISYQKNLIVDLYANLFVVGVLGYFSNLTLGLFERYVSSWAGQ